MSDLNEFSPKHISDILETDIYSFDLVNSMHQWREITYSYYIHVRINFYR